MNNNENGINTAVLELRYRLKKLKQAAKKYLQGLNHNEINVIMDGIEEAIESMTSWDNEEDCPLIDVPMLEHLKLIGHEIEKHMYFEWQGKIEIPHIFATFALFEAMRGEKLLGEVTHKEFSPEDFVKHSTAAQACIDGFESLHFMYEAKQKRNAADSQLVRIQKATKAAIQRDKNENEDERNEVMREFEEILKSTDKVVEVDGADDVKLVFRLRKKNNAINYSGCSDYIYYNLVEKYDHNGKRPLISQGVQFVYDAIKKYVKTEREKELAIQFAIEDSEEQFSPSWPSCNQ